MDKYYYMMNKDGLLNALSAWSVNLDIPVQAQHLFHDALTRIRELEDELKVATWDVTCDPEWRDTHRHELKG